MTQVNKKTVLISILAMIVLLIVVGTSYAYFTTTTQIRNQNVSLKAGTMILEFDDNDNGVNATLNVGESVTKKFTLKNTGTLEATGKIMWENLSNTYLDGSLTYRLEMATIENGTYSIIKEDTSVPVGTVSKSLLINNLTIPVGETYYYNLIITFNLREGVDQANDLNAELRTKFKLEA